MSSTNCQNDTALSIAVEGIGKRQNISKNVSSVSASAGAGLAGSGS